MPYISEKRRDELYDQSDYKKRFIQTKGELNYLITNLMIDYCNIRDISYTNLSDASDAARDAANEFDRIVLSLYEDKMRKKNGDVYHELIRRIKMVK